MEERKDAGTEGREAAAAGAWPCRRCGACCRIPGYVHLSGDDTEALAAALHLSVTDFTERYTRLTTDRRGLSLTELPSGACVFLLTDGSCRVHASKPRQCRDFPLAWRFDRIEEVCPAARGAGVEPHVAPARAGARAGTGPHSSNREG